MINYQSAHQGAVGEMRPVIGQPKVLQTAMTPSAGSQEAFK